jgi:hypothetical protein
MKQTTKKLPILLVFSITALCASWVLSQGRNPFAQPAKNLKVLKVEKPEDLRPIMRNFNQSLGVDCGFCHDSQDFAKDSKPHKEVARKMIEMVEKLNKEVFTWESAPRATCHMCHNGSPYPHFNPPQPAQAPPPAAAPATAPAAPGT